MDGDPAQAFGKDPKKDKRNAKIQFGPFQNGRICAYAVMTITQRKNMWVDTNGSCEPLTDRDYGV